MRRSGMARAYSLDLRERAVAAVIVAEQPQAQVAALFGVALATLTRWLGRWRHGQRLEAGQSRHGPVGQFGDPAVQEALRAQVAATPDARLCEHCRRWQKATGERVSETTMWRALRALGWTRKKSTL